MKRTFVYIVVDSNTPCIEAWTFDYCAVLKARPSRADQTFRAFCASKP